VECLTAMSDRGFRFHEHTADITLECWAPTLKQAFEEAALGAFEVILDTSTVEPLHPFEIDLQGIDLEELLVEWIGRLITLIDIESSFYSKFEVFSITQESKGFSMKGQAWGEPINLEKHNTRTEVKAMTYADLKIIQESEKTTIWFTLDL
jgi:SHS2 domain-containing protein